MSLPPGVHDLPLTFDYGDTDLVIHPVAVETPRGVLLVDVGLPGAVDQIADRLAAVDRSLDDVWAVLLTHHDGDHAGGCRDLLERTDATVFAHVAETPFVDGDRDPLKGDGDRYPPVPVDVQVVGDTRFATDTGTLHVVETPGHAPGHVSLALPERDCLLAADALNADGDDPLSGPKPEFTPDMDTAIESVGALAALEYDTVHCYHGGTVAATPDDVDAIYHSLRD
jgi:glyoxylase-like metal-dependent hydrolase (beta-lactamase superfamily II)